jgi:hypothetical protein
MPMIESKQRKARILVALGGVGAIGVGALFYYWFVAQPQQELEAAAHWQPTTCEITRSVVQQFKPASSVGTARNGTRSSYGAAIQYRYTVKGKVYTGRRQGFVEMTSDNRFDAERQVEQYAVGKTTGCWYDPAAPSESVIDRTLNWDPTIRLLPLGAIVAGIGMLLFAAFGDFDKVYLR